VLYVTARGLSTSPVPCDDRTFEVDFDFLDHRLVVSTSDARQATMRLESQTVADFYRHYLDLLRSVQVPAQIRHPWPNEVSKAIRFDTDTVHASYDADAIGRFWHALVQVDRVLKEFRSRFIGKCSPVHFWWGSFDLACTRFNGRPAPPHP